MHFLILIIFRKWPEHVMKYKALLVMISSLTSLLNDPAELKKDVS